MFLVSVIGIYSMPDTVALSENIFDIALWVKNPRWPPFVQDQTIDIIFDIIEAYSCFWCLSRGFQLCRTL